MYILQNLEVIKEVEEMQNSEHWEELTPEERKTVRAEFLNV